MAIPSTDSMTADQFFDWVNHPENAGRQYELERGRIVEVSPVLAIEPREAAFVRGLVNVNVARILGNYSRERKRGYACGFGTGIIWEREPDTVRGPTVSYFDRKVKFGDLNPRFSPHLPCLIVEVLTHDARFNRVLRRINQFL